MDRVPFDFCQQVAAYWKCCTLEEFKHRNDCLDQHVPDCKWTMKSAKERIQFAIGSNNGQWKHYFTNPVDSEETHERLSMEQLKKYPNLKNVTIRRIIVMETASWNTSDPLWSRETTKREDMEELMQLVIFLSNEPRLDLYTQTGGHYSSPEGSALLESLSEMTFARVNAWNYFPVYHQILENQFSRRRPTEISLQAIDRIDDFLTKHLSNGDIKILDIRPDVRFPVDVFDGIILSFLQNPAKYDRDHFDIEASFADSTQSHLENLRDEGICEMEDGVWCFTFTAKTNERIMVEFRSATKVHISMC